MTSRNTSPTSRSATSLSPCSTKTTLVRCNIHFSVRLCAAVRRANNTEALLGFSLSDSQSRTGTVSSNRGAGSEPRARVEDVATTRPSPTTPSSSLTSQRTRTEMANAPVSSHSCRNIAASRRRWECRTCASGSLFTRSVPTSPPSFPSPFHFPSHQKI